MFPGSSFENIFQDKDVHNYVKNYEDCEYI